MKKVIVIGCPGSGKSTFSRALQERTGLPLYPLDLLYWNADKTVVGKEVFRERLENVLKTDAWILDGNYHATLPLRLQACDTVFFLDYPTDVCLDGIRQRMGKPRADLPWIETEEDAEFIEFVKSYHKELRPKVLELLQAATDRTVHLFHRRNDAEEFLKNYA